MYNDRLDIFIDAAETLSLSAVAKKRFLTQPAISRQIRAFEDECGFPLFIRTNKGLRLTPEGAVMLSYCKKAQLEFENGRAVAQELRSKYTDTLRIGILSSIDQKRALHPYLFNFCHFHPGMDISIHPGTFHYLRQMLNDNQIDLAYTLSFDLHNYANDVACNNVAVVQPTLVLSNRHPLYKRKNLSMADLSEETFLIPEDEDSPGREEDMRNLLRVNGISVSRIHTVSNSQSVELQVLLGNGVGISDTASHLNNNPDCRSILCTSHEMIYITAIWKKSNLNPFISMFVNEQILDKTF